MRQSNIEGYLLVTSLQPRRCRGCAFAGNSPNCTFPQEKIARVCMADQDSIYIADNDEARAVYARRRLLGVGHDE